MTAARPRPRSRRPTIDRGRGGAGYRVHHEAGFTVIEALVAVTILLVAVMLSIQPIMSAIGRLDDSRAVSVSQHLAQAEIETIRSLDYEDIGIPGYTPSGILESEKSVEVEGRAFTIETRVTYEGSVTGLNVIDQGGDGVPGAWDPGVDYKVAVVTVTAADHDERPVMMETIVAPPNIGAHEGIANARVTLSAHEPFQTAEQVLPQLRLHADPAAPISSGSREAVQVFPAIPPADYVVEFGIPDGWLFHPEDIASGLDQITVTAGTLAETSLRVYKPARLLLTVTNASTGAPIPDARLSLTHVPTGQLTSYAPGEYIVDGLIPDAYDIVVTATGYEPFAAASVNVPEDYPDPDHELAVALVPPPPPTTTTTTTTTTIPGETTTTTQASTTTTTTPGGTLVAVTVTVRDNTGRRIHGATVEIPHPSRGLLIATTGSNGVAYFDLEEGITFTATGSTIWGHGTNSVVFDPEIDRHVEIDLTRPQGMGTMVLQYGRRASFDYRPSGGDTYTNLLVNDDGEASFVAGEGWYKVKKRCDSNSQVVGEEWVYVRAGSNRYDWVGGWCW